MNDLPDPNKRPVKDKQNSQFSEGGMYVREDDQDWGSAGMNDVQPVSYTHLTLPTNREV